jgi:hypothetical protein
MDEQKAKAVRADGLRVLLGLMYALGAAIVGKDGFTGGEVWGVTMVGLLIFGAVLGAGWIAGGTWRD